MEIACSLSGGEVENQLGAWADLGRSLRRTAGHRFWFDLDVKRTLREVAAAEMRCCPFLSLDVVPDGDAVRLDITSGHADAQPIVEALVEAIRRPSRQDS